MLIESGNTSLFQLVQQKDAPFIIPMNTAEEIFFQVTKDPQLQRAYRVALMNGKVTPFHKSHIISSYLSDESMTDAVFSGK